MSKIADILSKIQTAVYGREVREAIHDGIDICYKDVLSGKTIADSAAENANANAILAQTNAEYAKSKGDYAEEKGNAASQSIEILNNAMSGINSAINSATIATQNANQAAEVANAAAQSVQIVYDWKPNILDNTNFIDPVNQRNKMVYDEGMFIDRWGLWQATATLTNTGLRINKKNTFNLACLWQTVTNEYASGSDITISIVLSNTSMLIKTVENIDSGIVYTIGGGLSFKIDNKLYGFVFYLYMDMSTTTEYNFRTIYLEYGKKSCVQMSPLPNRSSEFIKCAQHFYRAVGSCSLGYLWPSNNKLYFHIGHVFPCKMRKTPTIYAEVLTLQGSSMPIDLGSLVVSSSDEYIDYIGFDKPSDISSIDSTNPLKYVIIANGEEII